MKPQLVDFNIFKKVEKPTPKIVSKIVPKTQSNNNNIGFLFNVSLLIFIVIGGYLLYKRKKEKKFNDIKYKKKLENLYNTINKYNG